MKIRTTIRSNSVTQFAGAITQNNGAEAALTIPRVGIGGAGRLTITSILIASIENLAWELWLFGASTFQEATPDGDSFRGFRTFAVADAKRYGTGPLYYYYIDGLSIPYQDQDNSGVIYATLVNRSAGAKTAGAAGAIVVQLNGEVELPG